MTFKNIEEIDSKKGNPTTPSQLLDLYISS